MPSASARVPGCREAGRRTADGLEGTERVERNAHGDVPATVQETTPHARGRVHNSFNAGIDMFMQPNNAPVFIEMLLAEVEAGRVSMRRIDEVCSAIETCIVLIVSGRPQVITDQLEQMDALVASWLPGSEGAGVAVAIATTRFATARAPASIGRSNYIP